MVQTRSSKPPPERGNQNSPHRTTGILKSRPARSEEPRHKSPHLNGHRVYRSAYSRSHRTSIQHNGLEDSHEDNAVRRSQRPRKLMFDTLNQSLLFDTYDETTLYRHDVVDENNFKGRRSTRKIVEETGSDSATSQDLDMYSRVKRQRRRISSSYTEADEDTTGVRTRSSGRLGQKDKEEYEEHEEPSRGDDADTEEEEDEREEEEEGEEEERRVYNLRENRKPVAFFVPENVPKSRIETRTRRDRPVNLVSPARKHTFRRRRPRAFHSSSSTSSSDDEEHFQHRREKSMFQARLRCLPLNFKTDDVTGVRKERSRIGSSLADTDPMTIDKNINFASVGGLLHHIEQLKEMILFPLLYPEFFTRFGIDPPRGVLFYGPPGTGKTMLARALVNECSTGTRRVAFFMRRGADCLSKWVGESERQLRLLFDQAYQMRPSIVFFDEIDGLAPVRSSRQDQIHSSIVSTLLALMDGLDSRGEVVVIGATNRLDAIDPALRRPGRFDRELFFSLPGLDARKEILKLHLTPSGNAREELTEELSRSTVGYSGADLRGVCTEACFSSLRRLFPQIYVRKEKLQIDFDSVQLEPCDFRRALKNLKASVARSKDCDGRPLDLHLLPLLDASMLRIVQVLKQIFPIDDLKSRHDTLIEEETDDQRVLPNLGPPSVCRPMLILNGKAGCGQTSHLAPAVLHKCDGARILVMKPGTLLSCSARAPEEIINETIREACRCAPSVLYLPAVDDWWNSLTESVRATLLIELQAIPAGLSVLLLITCSENIPDEINSLSRRCDLRILKMTPPTADERRRFFTPALLQHTREPPPSRRQAAERVLIDLPVAPSPEPRPLTAGEMKILRESEEKNLRELRLFLRDTLNKLERDKRFYPFKLPVDGELIPDYYQIITQPMSFLQMRYRINAGEYLTADEFLADLELISNNCLFYNPVTETGLRDRAHHLRDVSRSLVESELDERFDQLCKEIKESRVKRGEVGASSVSDYFRRGDNSHRCSRRLRGLEAEEVVQEEKTELEKEKEKEETQPVETEVTQQQPVRHRRRRHKRWSRGVVVSPKKKPRKENEEEDNSQQPDVAPLSDSSETEEEPEQSAPAPAEPAPEVAEQQRTPQVTPQKEQVDDVSSEQLRKAARKILDEEVPKSVIIDQNRLESLLHLVVDQTNTFNIDSLELAHSRLMKIIRNHRMEYDKTALLEDIGRFVRNLKQNNVNPL